MNKWDFYYQYLQILFDQIERDKIDQAPSVEGDMIQLQNMIEETQYLIIDKAALQNQKAGS